jgi:hypothetical protein
MINQIMPGVQNPLLAIAAKIREQISQQAMTPPQTSPPSAGAPEERDYTEGMERPELTAIKSEKEFKATPSRTTAFLVALGNILQDKQNLEAAKQQTAQNEYNAKLADAMEMNKLFKTGKMKREFDESDPDVLLGRKLKEQSYQQNEELFPLRLQRERTGLDRLLAKGMGGGRSSGGAVTSSDMNKMTDAEIKSITNWDDNEIKYYRSADSKLQNQLMKPFLKPDKAVDPLDQKRKQIKIETDELKLNFLKEMDPVRKAKLAQDIVSKEMFMNSLEQDYSIKPKTPEELTEKYAPSTKKSLKERAAELAAQGKSRKETEAILTQEGY